jgi:hypothetical protein
VFKRPEGPVLVNVDHRVELVGDPAAEVVMSAVPLDQIPQDPPGIRPVSKQPIRHGGRLPGRMRAKRFNPVHYDAANHM